MATKPPAEGRRDDVAVVAVGRRVVVREPTARDRDEYLALRRASWSFLRPWMVRSPTGRPPDDPREFEAILRTIQGDRHVRLFVCRKEDGAIAGVVNLNEIVRGPFLSAYLGYWIGAAFAKQGYMTEALQIALRHGFRTLGLHRVEANVIPRNAPSIALVRRAGFRREGLSRRYLRIDGRWQDHERWALLADDWRPLRLAPPARASAPRG